MKTSLKTPRLTLLPLSTEYLATAHAYASDRENTRFMLNLPNETEAETLDHLRGVERAWECEPQTMYEFAVMCGGVHIGAVSLEIDGVPDASDAALSAEIGWIIDRAHQKNGYATEAARALLGFARSLGVRRVTAHCDAENRASVLVMEKLGMALVGEYPGRKNKSSREERRERKYVLTLPYRVKITATAISRRVDLIEKYENPLENECSVSVGDVFYACEIGRCPRGLCGEAWRAMQPFADELLLGGGNFFDGWMKDPRSAMVSCSDGFRPVSFYIEAEDAQT